MLDGGIVYYYEMTQANQPQPVRTEVVVEMPAEKSGEARCGVDDRMIPRVYYPVAPHHPSERFFNAERKSAEDAGLTPLQVNTYIRLYGTHTLTKEQVDQFNSLYARVHPGKTSPVRLKAYTDRDGVVHEDYVIPLYFPRNARRACSLTGREGRAVADEAQKVSDAAKGALAPRR